MPAPFCSSSCSDPITGEGCRNYDTIKSIDKGTLEEAGKSVAVLPPPHVHSFYDDRRHNVLSGERSESHFQPIGAESVESTTNQKRNLGYWSRKEIEGAKISPRGW